MNPYDPQRPTAPEAFAGREELVEWGAKALESARVRRASGAALVHGHRGSGKTSALRKIEAMARSSGLAPIVVEIPLHERSSDADLLDAIVEEIRSFARRNRSVSGRWRTLVSRLTSVQVSAFGAAVEVGSVPTPSPATALAAWRETLAALQGIRLVVICVDDAERLDAAGIGTLKTVAEAETPLPVLLVVGAGPEFLRRLATHEFSPVARAFSGAVFSMAALTIPETGEALAAPLRAAHASGRWTTAGVARIHELSAGYPYLVKCLAHAAYAEGEEMGRADVDRAVPRALEVAAPWLDQEIPEASDGDIRTFARLVRSGAGPWQSREILELGINSIYIGRLCRLEVLKKVGTGRYELRKAPVVALFHELRRKLAPTPAR